MNSPLRSSELRELGRLLTHPGETRWASLGPWKSVRVLGKSVEVLRKSVEVRGKDTGATHCLSRDSPHPSQVSQPARSHPLSRVAVPPKPRGSSVANCVS